MEDFFIHHLTKIEYKCSTKFGWPKFHLPSLSAVFDAASLENSPSLQVGSGAISFATFALQKFKWQWLARNFPPKNCSRCTRCSPGCDLHSGQAGSCFKTWWRDCPDELLDAALLKLWWNSLSKIVSCLQRGLLSRIWGKLGWVEINSTLFWHYHLGWD